MVKRREGFRELIRSNVPLLSKDLSVKEAIRKVRNCCSYEKILYFYVVDEDNKLIGVVPTRRLLISSDDDLIKDIMVKDIVYIKENSSFEELLELFYQHKFLAIPVLDEEGRFIGVVDIDLITEEVINFEKRKEAELIFESIGYELSQIKSASSLKIFLLRTKWLTSTLISGFLCAVITFIFTETLLEESKLALFVALVLAIGEAISTQSMTITIQSIHSKRPTFRWLNKALKKELLPSLFISFSISLLVFILILIWFSVLKVALIVSFTLFLAIMTTSLLGVSIPFILHRLKINYKVAASPVVLAFADLFTLTFYFSIAKFFV